MTDAPLIYPEHDTGNGQRLADMFIERIRWVTDRQRWLLYDSRRWEMLPDDVKIEALAKRAAYSILDEAATILDDDERRRKHIAFANKSLEMPRIRAAVAAAKSVAALHVSSDSLDRDPLLINVMNGTFDVSTGELRPHEPTDFITRLIPHNYERGAYAPMWMNLLRRATKVDASGDTAAFIPMCLGYMLIGGNPEHRIFFVIGPGGTGKSQVIEIPRMAMGTDYAWESKPSLITRGRSDVHTEEVVVLERARYIAISETDGAMRLDEAAVKAFTGSKTIAVRELYKGQRLANVEATLIVATNEAPTIEKFDDAIRRRLVIIPSGPPLMSEEKDINLARKILATEAEGVVASLLNGARDWYLKSEGLHSGDGSADAAVFDRYLPTAVDLETDAFAHENDPVIQFIDEYVEFGPEDSGYTVPAPIVDRAYGDFRRSQARVGKRKLFEQILLYSELNGNPEVRKDARRFYGFRLREDAMQRLPFEG